MESSFRNIASIVEVTSGGEDLSRALLDLVEPLKDAPVELRHLATNIGQCACLLSCAVHLFNKHQALFRPELAHLLSDVNGHFGVIQETVKRWVKSPRGRWRRTKWLFWSGRIADFTRRLQALMSCLDVVVGLATIAIDRSQDVETWQLVLHRSQVLRSIEEARFETAHLYRSHGDKDPVFEVPRPYRGLLTLSESSRELAEWMSTILSAPTVPLKGAAGEPPPQGIIKYERSRYAFAPPIRPEPEVDTSNTRLLFAHDYVCLGALSRLGLQYTIEDFEQDGQEPSRKVVVHIDRNMKDFEVDLIISTSQVMRAVPSPEWKPSTSPWMRLPPEEALTRLLKYCTVLADDETDSIFQASTPSLYTALRTNGDAANGTTGPASTKFQLEAGDEFSKEEFERRESLRDWAIHPPVQTDLQRMANSKWDNRSRISDDNKQAQTHAYPMILAQQNQPALPPGPPMPTLHESPPVSRRLSYTLGMDPAWIQDFQERIDLRDKVRDLEQKLKIAKEEARVSVMELENKLDDSKKLERDLATRLAQEHETQQKFEGELKSVSMEKAQSESNEQAAQARLTKMEGEINDYKDEITRLRGEMSTLEAVSAQAQKSEETQRGMDTYREEIEKWKSQMIEQQATLQQQYQSVSDREVAELREFVTKQISELRSIEQEALKSRQQQELAIAEQKIAELQHSREKDAIKIDTLEKKKASDATKIEELQDEISIGQKKYDEKVQALSGKIKKLKKKKSKAQSEVRWLKESQQERIEAEKQAARAAAILEFRESLRESAKEAVQKEMDDAAQRQADLGMAGQDQEPMAEASGALQPDPAVVPKDRSVLSSSGVDVMSFVVDDGEAAEWPEDKTETDVEDAESSPAVDPPEDTAAGVPGVGQYFEGNETVDGDQPQLEADEVGEKTKPRVEDFLVTTENDDDCDYNKSMVLTVSRPWRGMGDIDAPNFEVANISPLYVRGNGMGETLYCGSSPIHVRELAEEYKVDTAQQYLTVSKLYLDTTVLEQFGIDFVELEDGFLSIDPAVTTPDIEKLFQQTYIRREIEAFKALKKAYATSAAEDTGDVEAAVEEVGEDADAGEDDTVEDGVGHDEDVEREAKALAGTCRMS